MQEAKAVQKNRFAAAMEDDSDDEVQVQKTTKTQKKKEERKITEKVVKSNPNKMAEGGFEIIDQTRQATAPRGGGGRGGDRGRGGRGGRGGEGRGRGEFRGGRGGRGGDRPQTAGPRLDADGNPIQSRGGGRGGGNPYRGKARQEENHPFDRKDGTGKARRGNKKEGAGRANWGEKNEQVYKRKDGDAVEAEESKAVEEQKVAKPEKEEKEQFVEEIIGVSMDDFLATMMTTNKKEARKAEGIKGEKVQGLEGVKEHQATVQKNSYMKGVHAKTADANNKMFNFQDDETEDFGGRGGRRGTRGGRGGDKRESIANQGRKNQNAARALKKTAEDFPTL